MPKKKKEYQRLRGKGRSLASYQRLYLGTDHLLSVTSHYMSEDYCRFYYQDIQALITRKTSSGLIQNIIYGSLFLIFIIPLYWLREGWAVFFSIMAGSCMLLLLINWLRGPTCTTYIMTPVQTMRLSSLSRIKTFNRAMIRLRPLIEGFQGNLSRAELSEIYREDESQPTPSTPFISSQRHLSGTFHKVFFSFILIQAGLILTDIFYQNPVISLLATLVMMVVTILLIISLVKQSGTDLYKAVKIFTWSTIPYLSLNFIASYIIFFYLAIKNPTVANNQWELIKLVSALSPNENSLLMSYSIFSLFFSLMIAIPGLILTVRFQKAHKSALQSQVVDTPLSIKTDHE